MTAHGEQALSRGFRRFGITARERDGLLSCLSTWVTPGPMPGQPSRNRRLPCERDGVDVPPVVALVEVGSAAIAEEPCGVCIGAVAEILDGADAGGGEAGNDIAGKIEQGVLGPWRWLEKPFGREVLGPEAGNQFGPDLVIGLPDGRPERDRNASAVGPALLHGGDGRFEHAGGGAAPAG